MSKKERLSKYADVKEVADAALAAGGGTYELETYGAAVHWRQRFYKFRILYSEVLGGANPYDFIILRRLQRPDNIVILDIKKPKGVFTPATRAPAPEEDELLKEARDLAKDLGL